MKDTNASVIKYAGRAALLALLFIYIQSWMAKDLQSNPNWTISRVMVYPYNYLILKIILFPCFLIICISYSVRHESTRIRAGSVVAITGGIGLIQYPVTTNESEHAICALVVFLSSIFWFPECSNHQFIFFAASSIFFIGGFAMGAFYDSKLPTKDIDYLSFVPSICCAMGEFGIFITWGFMVQNEKRVLREKTN
jgi:hypothetical protein